MRTGWGGKRSPVFARPQDRRTAPLRAPGLSETVSALLNARGGLENQGRGRQGKVSEAGEEREEKPKATERAAWGGLASTKKEMGTPRGLSTTNQRAAALPEWGPSVWLSSTNKCVQL